MNDTHLECRIHNLKNVAQNYDNVVAERDEIHTRMSNDLECLDLVKTKHTSMFNDLMCRYNELSREYDAEQKQLVSAVQDNNHLRREVERLDEQLDNRKVTLQKREMARLNLPEHVQMLRERLADADTIATELRDEHQCIESELKDRKQELVGLQKTLLDRRIEQSRLEQELNAVQDQNNELQSSMNATKAEYEMTAAQLCAEYDDLQAQLNEKSAELVAETRCLDEKRDEAETRQQRTKQLKITIDVLQKKYYEEKAETDRQIVELKAQIKSAASELMLANAKLSDAQTETNKLKCQLQDAAEAIRQLESTKGQLEREMRRTKFAVETAERTTATERKRHDAEKEAAVCKWVAADKEMAELRRLADKQEALIRRLKKKSCALKCSAAEIAPDMTAVEMGKRIAVIFGKVDNDDDDDDDDDDDNDNNDNDDDDVDVDCMRLSQPKSFGFSGRSIFRNAAVYATDSTECHEYPTDVAIKREAHYSNECTSHDEIDGM